MGVTTTGPVRLVPITGPPWKISGGLPFAVSPAPPTDRESLTAQPEPVDTALTTPEMWPTPRPANAPQELADDVDACVAASAAEPAVRVAVVAAATKIKVARRPRRLNGLAIPSVLRRLHRTPGLSAATLRKTLGRNHRFAALSALSRCGMTIALYR